MLSFITNLTSLLLSSLLVGAMFCVWLILNPSQLDASHYVILQQQGIRTLHPSMPRLGALSIAATLAAALIARHDRPRMSLLIAAAIFFIISGVITSRVNMPINASVIHWSSSAPPNDWTEFRDTWWRWHRLRAASGGLGLVLLIIANLLRSPATAQTFASLRSCRPLFSALLQGMSLLL